MPLYEYECTDCGQRTELLQRHGDPPLESCPQCGGAVRKLFSAPAVQFKGSGWYVTDYGGKGKQAEASAGKSSGADKETGKGDAGGGKESKEAPPAKSSAKADGGGEGG